MGRTAGAAVCDITQKGYSSFVLLTCVVCNNIFIPHLLHGTVIVRNQICACLYIDIVVSCASGRERMSLSFLYMSVNEKKRNERTQGVLIALMWPWTA